MRNSLSINVLLLVLTLGAFGQATAQEASTVEPRVDGVLHRMSDLLADLPSFAFKAEEIVDEVLDSGFKAEVSLFWRNCSTDTTAIGPQSRTRVVARSPTAPTMPAPRSTIAGVSSRSPCCTSGPPGWVPGGFSTGSTVRRRAAVRM